MAHADIRALDPCILEAIRTVREMLKRRTYPKLRQTRTGRTNYQRRFRECWQQWRISIRHSAESRDSGFRDRIREKNSKIGLAAENPECRTEYGFRERTCLIDGSRRGRKLGKCAFVGVCASRVKMTLGSESRLYSSGGVAEGRIRRIFMVRVSGSTSAKATAPGTWMLIRKGLSG